MPWMSCLGNDCLLSSGRWKWCDWHKAPMLFGCFLCITNAIRKMTFVCLPAALWMVWILHQVCTLWRASRQSWENLPTSKASKKWCQQRPEIQFTGIRKSKNHGSIVMKLTLIGHDDHTSKTVLSYQFLTMHAAFFCTGIRPRKLWHSRSPFWTSPPCTTAQRTSRESSPEGQWNNQRLSGWFLFHANFSRCSMIFVPSFDAYTPSR